MIDLLGHFAYAALALGTWMVGKRLTLGWAMRAAGSATWLVLGIIMAMSSIWFWSAVFLATDLTGFYRWKRRQDEKQN